MLVLDVFTVLSGVPDLQVSELFVMAIVIGIYVAPGVAMAAWVNS